jgi:hypothetical protein
MNMNRPQNLMFTILSLSVFIFISSCSGGKETIEKTATKSNAVFIKGQHISKDETYSSIKGSVHRLHTIMCGKFVQYNVALDPERKKYTTWLINEGQDSVVIYHLPVGTPDREGYWMYNCQVMTSLPNAPLHATFSKLVEISRDTIHAIYYELPENFDASLQEMLANPKKAFASVDLMTLKISEGSEIPYVRESPIHYRGETGWSPDSREDNEGGFLATYFLVRPQMMVFGSAAYDKDKKFLGQTKGERLMKDAMINPDLLK